MNCRITQQFLAAIRQSFYLEFCWTQPLCYLLGQQKLGLWCVYNEAHHKISSIYPHKLTVTIGSVLLLPLHPFNGLFSRTTWVSWYQKGRPSLDLNEARDDGIWGWQWHQLDHRQTMCTTIFTGRMLYLTPSQQCHSTESTKLAL